MRLWFFFHDQDLGVRIKNAVQEIIDGYITDGSKHIGLKAVTLPKFGKILDKVITYWYLPVGTPFMVFGVTHTICKQFKLDA